MRTVEAVFRDGVFWPCEHIELESPSRVQLDIEVLTTERAESTDEIEWRWDPQALSNLKFGILKTLEEVPAVRNLDEISNVLDSELQPVDQAEVERAIDELLTSGYIRRSLVPATLEGYTLTAMGKVCEILGSREEIDRWRSARGLAPKRQPALPIPEVFVRSFQDLSIAFLQLGQRIDSILEANGFETLGSLCEVTRGELLRIARIGADSVDAIEFELRAFGLELKSVDPANTG